MIREHVTALMSALGAGLDAYLVGDVPPEPATPYVVLTPSGGHPDRDTLAGGRSRLDMTFSVTAVGASPDEALWAADAARDRLLDVRLSIPGRRSWPVVHGDSQPVRQDPLHVADGTGRPLLICVDTYGLASVPATAS